jgi:hypothetical protein
MVAFLGTSSSLRMNHRAEEDGTDLYGSCPPHSPAAVPGNLQGFSDSTSEIVREDNASPSIGSEAQRGSIWLGNEIQLEMRIT